MGTHTQSEGMPRMRIQGDRTSMISRRRFFGLMAGLVAAPWLPKQSEVSYRYKFTSGPPPVDAFRHPRRFHKE